MSILNSSTGNGKSNPRARPKLPPMPPREEILNKEVEDIREWVVEAREALDDLLESYQPDETTVESPDAQIASFTAVRKVITALRCIDRTASNMVGEKAVRLG